MRGAVTSLLIAVLGLVPGGAAWAETRFHPMHQFMLKQAAPPLAVDRSAGGYARCAGMYRAAVQDDAGNSFAREAETLMMAKALSIGRPAEALYRIRDDESVQVAQHNQQQQAHQRKLYAMSEAEQAAHFDKEGWESVRRILNDVVFAAACEVLLQELRAERGQK